MIIMIDPSLRDEILKSLSALPYEKQKRVLQFVLSLANLDQQPKDNDLIRFAGIIEKDDLKIMEREIEESCERIDFGEW
ncbi:phytoene/squalene synthetase [Moorella thermoacetica Y72]|uniref:Phytoene/squalene synthetase n=1 Tax=Moorella thermoacetica Y72 TaxID=1325331 RepID=A0A0S6UHB4_NEOTH|nr:hypothetical protein [Moorella thermoacetica]GAF27400.1 phytoene/squalene synthetase [Moorella thermoacetica Y72]